MKKWLVSIFTFFFILSCSKKGFSEGESESKHNNIWDKIVLRIDDVPPLSSKLANTIRKLKIKKVIVSVIGAHLNSYKNSSMIEVLKEGIKEGWVVYNHSYWHKKGSFYRKYPHKLKEEIEMTQKLIKEILGVEPKVFACPGGRGNLNRTLIKLISNEMGLKIDEGWDIDTYDWHPQKSLTSTQIAKQIKQKLKKKEKVIILIHGTKKRWDKDLEIIDSLLKTRS